MQVFQNTSSLDEINIPKQSCFVPIFFCCQNFQIAVQITANESLSQQLFDDEWRRTAGSFYTPVDVLIWTDSLLYSFLTRSVVQCSHVYNCMYCGLNTVGQLQVFCDFIMLYECIYIYIYTHNFTSINHINNRFYMNSNGFSHMIYQQQDRQIITRHKSVDLNNILFQNKSSK